MEWTQDPFLAAVALRKILQLLCMSGIKMPLSAGLERKAWEGKAWLFAVQGARGGGGGGGW